MSFPCAALDGSRESVNTSQVGGKSAGLNVIVAKLVGN